MKYILDISFFEPPYKQIRNYIKQYSVQQIVNNIKGFDNVYSGQTILSVNKSQNYVNQILWKDFETQDIVRINKSNFNFIKPFSKKDEYLINKIEMNSNKFDSYFGHKEIRTCAVLTGRTNDFVTDKINPISINNFYPFLEGAKGLPDRFKIVTPCDRILEYDYAKQLKISNEFKIELEKKGIKNKKRIGLGNEIAYKSPKIFIRQSAKKLIAAYTEEYLCTNNSIYIIFKKLLRNDTKFYLKYICCLLNSELLTFYALKKNIIRIEKGKIPQIRLSDLYKLPMKFCDKQEMEQIIQYGFENYCNSIEMDYLIAKLFNISNVELNYIIQYNRTIEKGLKDE
ncbi:MAG: TaqI-like C-terminal specificity domain-containing protein [bacterium]